jgi:hypothetical protein
VNKLRGKYNHQCRWAEFGQISAQEKILAHCITWTFGFYLVGALYLVAPIIGWFLLMNVISQNLTFSTSEQNCRHLVLLWIIGAAMLEVALIIGHINFDLGFGKIVKSTFGWAKGWALISIFIIIGYRLEIRSSVIVRAACVIGLIALLITPFLVFAYLIGLPQHLYTSPLKVLGGAGAEFFSIFLYEIDPGNNSPRWRFFAPWAPAVGFVANIYFLCAWFEKDRTWRAVGLLGNACMIFLAASRMGVLVMLIVPTATWFLSRMTRPWIIISASIATLFLALLIEPISYHLLSFLDEVKSARADSTRVRESLGNIALYRWQAEAFWFGHGTVESGSHLVEFMPIGSHHHWLGLLFVKGLVGLLSYLVPFSLTCLALLAKAQYQINSRLALGMCLILMFFSMSENIEALAYLTWPAWLLIGCGLRSSLGQIDTYSGNFLGQFRLNSHHISHYKITV